MVTWSRKPSAAIHQLCTFPIPTYGPSSGLFLQLHPLRECDLIPSCRFQPSVDVSAFCSHFPNPYGIWFVTSLHDGQWYNLCLSVSSSLSQPLHFFSSDQPMSHNLFYTHPPSTTTFLFTCRCLSVHASLVFLRSTAWIGSSHTPSVSSIRALLPHVFQ